MIELYHAWNSTCSQKVRICIEEKGLSWAGHVLNLRRFDQVRPEFLAINPAAMVPVLIDGGVKVTESRIINEYLEDAYPQAPLLPKLAAGRAAVRIWTKYVDDVPTEAVKIPSFMKNIRPQAVQMSDEELDAAVRMMPDKGKAARWRRAAREGYTDAEIRPSVDQLGDMLDRMESALASSPWLAGPDYTLADVDVAPFVHRLVQIDLAPMIAGRPHVAGWYARVAARPAFVAAMSY